MKKFLLIFSFFQITVLSVHSYNSSFNKLDFRLIEVEYHHSMRFPYRDVYITLGAKKGIGYYCEVITKAADNHEEFDYSNQEYTIPISSDEFNSLFDKCVSLNTGEIIKSNFNILGTDGTEITLSYGSFQNQASIQVWSYDYNTDNRGLDGIKSILDQIFIFAQLYEKIQD